MYQLVLLIHVLVAMAVIGLVLIQHGKGADIGAAFGSGASNTVFGSQGTGGFLFKLTGILALTFFATSLTLSAMVGVSYSKKGQVIVPQQTIELDSKMPVPVDDAQ